MENTTATTAKQDILKLSKEEATTFFSEFYNGEHHFPGNIKEWGYGWVMSHHGDIGTFDFNQMTRLVLMAHRYAIVVYVKSGGPRRIQIILHKRLHDRSEDQFRRHPTLLDLCDMAENMLPTTDRHESRGNLSARVGNLTEFLESKGLLDEYEDWYDEKYMELKRKHEL